jgi:hypothetical protein
MGFRSVLVASRAAPPVPRMASVRHAILITILSTDTVLHHARVALTKFLLDHAQTVHPSAYHAPHQPIAQPAEVVTLSTTVQHTIHRHAWHLAPPPTIKTNPVGVCVALVPVWHA